MSLARLTTDIQIDSPPPVPSLAVQTPMVPLNGTLELWSGDVTTPGALATEDILVFNLQPDETFVGSSKLSTALKAANIPGSQNLVAEFNPSIQSAIYGTALGAKNVMLWSPVFQGMKTDVPKHVPVTLTPGQSAPYRTDEIFKAVQAYWGHIPRSIVIPITTSKTKPDDVRVMLQSLMHSALKFGGFKDFVPSSIKIVLDVADAKLIAAFDAIAQIYNGLAGPKYPANMPSYGTTPYRYFAKAANAWLSGSLPPPRGSVTPDIPKTMTSLQALVLRIYTDNYFHPIQAPLRRYNSSLPQIDGAGLIDLAHADYGVMIPFYAAMSAGLLNLQPFHGGLFRGTTRGGNPKKLWTPFEVGSNVRITSYMSTADQYAGPGLPWQGGTPEPWANADSHIRIQSHSVANGS